MTNQQNGICAKRRLRWAWSESSLCAWRKLWSLTIHWAHSEDSDQTGQMPRLIWVFAGCTVILLVLSWGGSYYYVPGLDLKLATPGLKSDCKSLMCYLLTYKHQKVTQKCQVRLFWHFPCKMSRDMTKPTKWLCAQRRLRSVWVSAQSDQPLLCALNGQLRTQAFFMRTAKTLIRLGGCPGWSESSLGTHSFCWFCHVMAQMTFPCPNHCQSHENSRRVCKKNCTLICGAASSCKKASGTSLIMNLAARCPAALDRAHNFWKNCQNIPW